MYMTILQKSTPLKLSKKTAEATGFSKLKGISFTSPSKHYKESRECVDAVALDTDAICLAVHEL